MKKAVRASRLLSLLACWFCALAVRASDFDAANQLYDQGKFAEARAAYQKLANAGEVSANLFYNLGNANQRLGNLGEALLDYERALALDSGHAEARANLKLLRGQTGAVPWPGSWIDRLFPWRWIDAHVVAGCIAGWAAVFLLFAIFTTQAREKSGLWFGAVVALSIAGYSAAAVWHIEQDRMLAVVTAKAAEVHLAPAESAAPATVLPAGSEVRVLSERGDWIYCALPTQGRGWIQGKALGLVRSSRS